MNFTFRLLLLCALGVTFARAAVQTGPGVNLPTPPVPLWGDHADRSGTVTILVAFDAKGNVASCRVAKSSGSSELDGETVDFVRNNWRDVKLAGTTQEVPIEYLPRFLPFGTPAVPNLLLPGEPSVSFPLYVSFDADGYVHAFSTFQMNLALSGHTQIDKRILKWIYTHWRSKDYRHQTVKIDLHFDPPPAGAKSNASDSSAK